MIWPRYPANSSKQQQISQWSDGHENGAKMTATSHLPTLMPSATCLAPSPPSLLLERFRLVIALVSKQVLGISDWTIKRGYRHLYGYIHALREEGSKHTRS
jgi:hypothetical protein